MKKVNRFIALVMTASFAFLLFAGTAHTEANDDIKVVLDGNPVSFDVNPEIIDGRTMVPLRKIFEEIGALVKWNDETQTVSARKSSKTVSLTVNSDEMQIDKGNTDDNGNAVVETVSLEVAPQIISGRTLVPARAISEAFGLNVDWDNDTNTVIITSDSDEDESWKENTGTISLTDLTYTGSGIEIDGNQILITSGGDYTISGALADGNISVNTEEKVKLRLSGASITSNGNPCIYVENADKAYITVTEGTENNITYKGSENGALYSKDNLEIKGNGTLNITSDAGHGIKASDNLTIENGTLNITAADDGINVNDTFKMTGGTVNISAKGDGIDSESIAVISGGELNIETTGEPIESETAQVQTDETAMKNFRGGMNETPSVEFETSTKGIKADWMLCVSGGEITVNSADHAVHCADEIEITGGSLKLNSAYAKGISGHGNVTIDGADTLIDITKSTEGIESKNVLTVNDGTVKIVSSDDGINATGGKSGEMQGGGRMGQGVRPDDANTVPPEIGAEGLDKAQKEQNGNNVQNGMNGKGGRGQRPPMQEQNGTVPDENRPMNPMPEGADMQRPGLDGSNPMPGENGGMGGNQKDCLIINGGNIEVYAGDDCLDANGNLVLNGGTIKGIKVNGSFTGPNSVLDADGKVNVSEGVTIIAAGSGGTQGSLNIPQNTITVYSESSHSANESITVKDESGNTLLEYSPQGSFSAALITSPKLELGKTYTVCIGDETYDMTLAQQNTAIGTQRTANFGKNRTAQ